MKTFTRLLVLAMVCALCMTGVAVADTSILTESGFPIVKISPCFSKQSAGTSTSICTR